jgi:hypothetical protein
MPDDSDTRQNSFSPPASYGDLVFSSGFGTPQYGFSSESESVLETTFVMAAVAAVGVVIFYPVAEIAAGLVSPGIPVTEAELEFYGALEEQAQIIRAIEESITTSGNLSEALGNAGQMMLDARGATAAQQLALKLAIVRVNVEAWMAAAAAATGINLFFPSGW